MSKLASLTPIAAVLALSVTGAAQAAENPFALKPAAGVVVADASEAAKKDVTEEAGKKVESAKKDADKAKTEKAGKEGQCGEGKCGSSKAPAASKGMSPYGIN